MRRFSGLFLFSAVAATTVLTLPIQAQDSSGRLRDVPFGSEAEIQGVIVERSGDELLIRDYLRGETRVLLTPTTEIKERKKNPFRKASRYSPDQLFLGLKVEVKGRGDRDGALVAEEIKFTKDDLKVAETITSRVAPVESRLDETQMSLESAQNRLAETEKQLEETTQRVDGQLGELDAAYRTARAEAQEAQRSADGALSGVDAANRRISSLDDYEEVSALTIQFTFNSSSLSDDAKPELDTLVQRYRDQKGYLIEVAGYASSDGNSEYNRILSQKRADSVVHYLKDQHGIPLRRIITPYGFGENSPIADNQTLDGRKQNRRVEVRVLVSRGLEPMEQDQRSEIGVEDIR